MAGAIERMSIEDRYWSKVDTSGGPDACWPWTAATQPKPWNYGVFHPFKGKTVRAHRFALELSLGRPLGEGMQARHVVCDNPICCNPRHLAEGSNADNVADMVGKGRQARGEAKVRSAVLTEREVLNVRHRVAAGELIRHEAARLGVHESLISMIVRGHRWRHVGGPITHRYKKAESHGK